MPNSQAHSKTPSPVLRPGAAAAYLQLTKQTLARWRMEGKGPPFIKAGPQLVLYDRTDLDAFLASRKVRSTAEAAAAGFDEGAAAPTS